MHFNSLQLVEFMEMYQLQGATHFIFYNHTVGPDVESILNRYQGGFHLLDLIVTELKSHMTW